MKKENMITIRELKEDLKTALDYLEQIQGDDEKIIGKLDFKFIVDEKPCDYKSCNYKTWYDFINNIDSDIDLEELENKINELDIDDADDSDEDYMIDDLCTEEESVECHSDKKCCKNLGNIANPEQGKIDQLICDIFEDTGIIEEVDRLVFLKALIYILKNK